MKIEFRKDAASAWGVLSGAERIKSDTPRKAMKANFATTINMGEKIGSVRITVKYDNTDTLHNLLHSSIGKNEKFDLQFQLGSLNETVVVDSWTDGKLVLKTV